MMIVDAPDASLQLFLKPKYRKRLFHTSMNSPILMVVIWFRIVMHKFIQCVGIILIHLIF
jgi:hypothetical protein